MPAEKFHRAAVVEVGFHAASEFDFRPQNAIDTARSRVDTALHSERANVDEALGAAAEQAVKFAARIRELVTALQTVQRLVPNDAGVRQVVRQALENATR